MTLDRLRQIPLGAWLALCVTIASLAALVVWAPPAMWSSLATADYEHLVGVIGLVSTALALALTRFRAAWQGSAPPPAARVAHRCAHGIALDIQCARCEALDSTAVQRRDARAGFASARLLAALSAAALVLMPLVCALMLGGCTSSAVQQHTTAIRVTATALGAASDAAEAVYSAELAQCRDEACIASLERDWAPVETASAGVIVALQGWIGSLEVVRAAGEDAAPTVLWRAAFRAAARVGAAWDDLARATRAHDLELPTVSVEAAGLAAIGGE